MGNDCGELELVLHIFKLSFSEKLREVKGTVCSLNLDGSCLDLWTADLLGIKD